MHVTTISRRQLLPAPAQSIVAPNYPPGIIGWILSMRDAIKGIVY